MPSFIGVSVAGLDGPNSALLSVVPEDDFELPQAASNSPPNASAANAVFRRAPEPLI
jgi:hypothetical protein